MNIFNIAGVNLKIMSKEACFFHELNYFTSSDAKDYDLKIKISKSQGVTLSEGEKILNERISWVRSNKKDILFQAFICKEESKKVLAVLEINDSWTEAEITYCEDKDYSIDATVNLLLEIFFRNYILQKDGIVIHAAAIDWKGKGIAFTAPSGGGKSTQAMLWKKYMGAKILNDDRPTIRRRDDKFSIYGTPWSGSSLEFINDSAPLSAIFIIQQSKVNVLEKLNKHQAVVQLTPRCFLPYFDSGLMDLALLQLEKVINEIPVYLLKCTPEKEAVELVYECVK